MRARHKKSGLSLTEMVVVVAAVAMLASISTPAVKALFDSMATKAGAKAMISAGLATARAIAAKEQRYAGVRFQTDNPYDPLGVGTSQYMIFIVHDYDNVGLDNGFRAVEGIEPVKLPDNIGVTDLRIGGNYEVDEDVDIDDRREFSDTTTFSIVFSPGGKLVIHPVEIRNRDGERDSAANIGGISDDDIFNKKADVDEGIAMFYQDDYWNAIWSLYTGLHLGLREEPSRNMFIIYDREQFKQAYDAGKKAYSDYLEPLKLREGFIYINPYTGTIVTADR